MIATPPAQASVTEGARLAAIYDSILDAQFDRADGQLKQACPPAPTEACLGLRVVSLSWQILINPENRSLDQQFEKDAAASIAASEAWTKREPQRAEAWFYLAGAYAPRVQWRILRGQRVAAAYDGKRIKEALERALSIDPTLTDAHFGIGLYRYYADVAPTAAKMLRWLLLLPGGNREQGLREMLEVQTRGQLLNGEADYQLHQIYLWYEHKFDEAFQLLTRLSMRYPNNPLFRQKMAETRDSYFHDHAGSAALWRDLLDRALAAQVYTPKIVEVRARLGLANELAEMNRLDDAIDQLKIVTMMQPNEPAGAAARAERELRALITRKSSR